VAIFHLTAKPISRAEGRSSTAAAAYRAGVKITDERTGETFDFTRKGGVEHAELILPGGATADRGEFWNKVEKHHKRGDAVLVREVEVALPSELTPEQRQALAVGYARELADRYGVAADVAIHAPNKDGDERNHHAHIMLSACHVQPDGTLGKKAVELDPIHCQKHKIENMVARERVRWGELANAALERHGHDARIDHRSHAERGIEAEPTQHLGVAAVGFERRTGQKSDKRLRDEASAVAVAEARVEAVSLKREAAVVEAVIQTAERELLEAGAALKRALDEATEEARLEGMTARELDQEIAQVMPEPVSVIAAREPAVVAAATKRRALEQKVAGADNRAAKAKAEVAAWRKKNPIRALFSDIVRPSPYVLEREALIKKSEAIRKGAALEIKAAKAEEARLLGEAEQRLAVGLAPKIEKVAQLKRLRHQKRMAEGQAEDAALDVRKHRPVVRQAPEAEPEMDGPDDRPQSRLKRVPRPP